MQSRLVLFHSVMLLVATGMSATAGDWPGWRGPNRDDISAETGLLKNWPEGGPKKLWTSKEAGLGYSGMSIVGDVVYTMGADSKEENAQEFLIALKVSDGSKIWQAPVGKYLENNWGGGPRSTPTVVGDLVIGIGGQGIVLCASAKDGSKIWSVNLTELGGAVPNWGYCESALVDGDRVLCTPGGAQGTVVCLNLKTGEKIWQSEDIKEAAHYSSVIVVNHFGKKQYIQLTEQKLFGLDTENGKLLWQTDWPGRTAVIPTPVYHKGQIYVTSGYGVGCMLVTVSPDNKVEKIYDNKVMKNHHGGVILLDGHIYGHSDSVGWVCQKLETGEQVWSEDGKNESKGSVAYAEGLLYCLKEGSGECMLAEATTAGWKEISKFKLDPQSSQRADRGKIWTHPTIANGRLYLRDQEMLSCYDIRAEAK
ncbi:MAG: PQQ-binding-like beta-propeller repeat protein [Planctomyces sp.]